jgi:hypothetical protein
VVIRALASEGRKPKAGSARAVADILLGTTGADLTRLKVAINLGGGRHDLFRIVYRDLVGSAAAQADVLQHLAMQAAVARDELSGLQHRDAEAGSPMAQSALLPLQVISDLDDTLRQGWLDSRVPRHMPYPGAAALIRELRQRSALHPMAGGLDLAVRGVVGAGLPELLEAPQSLASMLPPLAVGAPRGAEDTTPPDRTHSGISATSSGDFVAVDDESHHPPTHASEEAVEALAGGWLRTHPQHNRAEELAMHRMVPPTSADDPASDDPLGQDGTRPIPPAASTADTDAHPALPTLRTWPLAAGRGAIDASSSLFILTARPSGAFDILRKQTLDGLGWLHAGTVSLLTGSLSTGVSTAAIAEKKAANLTMHLALWRECRCVFLGDSGQGDAAVAAEALARHSKQVLATFIHDVNPASVTTGDGSHKAALREAGVFLFNTYSGAAAAAVARGILPPDAAVEVVEAAVREAAEQVEQEANRKQRTAAEASAGDSSHAPASKEAAPSRNASKRLALAKAYQKLVVAEATAARQWLEGFKVSEIDQGERV